MIEGFSKFAVLYLAPVLMLTALFLSTFAFLAPTAMLHDQVALLTVSPSTALTNPQAQASDGPSLFLGLLGSFVLIDVSNSTYLNPSQVHALGAIMLVELHAPTPQ
jgi:hypothetical protein